MRRVAVLLPLLAACGGCPVWQSQDVPVEATRETDPTTGYTYRQYVPSTYTSSRDWPLVVTLHGTVPYDTSRRQIDEWKRLAEDKQFIVVAPDLRSTQGLLPVIDRLWFADLERDEEAIIAVIEDVCRKYRVDRSSVLLHAFSAGGYPLLWTGLRHPERFSMIIGRGINARMEMLERIKLSDAARKLPIVLMWGKDDWVGIQKQSWMAYTYLRERGFDQGRQLEFRGGHVRRPDLAYELWREHLPERHRR